MALITLAEKLVDAEAKLHQLLTGSAPRVVVDQNGERVEFNTANSGQLKAYVGELKSKIANGGTEVSRRPLMPFF
jgi:hypothetical protein